MCNYSHKFDCGLKGDCKPKRISSIRTLSTSPDYMIIQLNIFFSNDGSNCTSVSPEEYLELPTGERFELCGVGHHLGRSQRSGHFIASVKIQDRWMKCDDTKIVYVDETTAKLFHIDSCVYSKVAYTDFNVPSLPKKQKMLDDMIDLNKKISLQNLQDTKVECKNCNKRFVTLYSHLSRAKKCQTGYDMDKMKKEIEQNKKKSDGEWKKVSRHKRNKFYSVERMRRHLYSFNSCILNTWVSLETLNNLYELPLHTPNSQSLWFDH